MSWTLDALAPPIETVRRSKVNQLNSVIADIDDTIRQVRTTIFELGLDSTCQGPRASVLALVEELTSVLGFEVNTSIDGPVDATLSDETVEHLLATLREALTNIGRHAQASRTNVMLSVDSHMCRLQVLDNGHGIQGGGREGGHGLVNMRRRAEKLNGGFEVETPVDGGTLLIWQVPVGR
jgi:signal transduction histidine kinase